MRICLGLCHPLSRVSFRLSIRRMEYGRILALCGLSDRAGKVRAWQEPDPELWETTHANFLVGHVVVYARKRCSGCRYRGLCC